ncbi:MAG TPA: FKBP-type peptidyl-prolyl cis-trans isomerase [Acidimicrobiales bacterium]|jgi:peptidylprolyl isomerase
MASKGKGARQQAVRRARIAAAAHAAERQKRQKRITAIGLAGLLIVVLAVGAVVATAHNDSSNKASSIANTSSGSTGPGAPCVTMADALPAGAPYVPVQVGPPPAQLVTQELRAGTGPAVQPGDSVVVNYVGVACSTGKIFDSSYSRGQPASFALSDVIPGWQQGIPGMQVGGQRLLGIPPNLAYGANPPPGIAANETLWFVVELESIGASSTTDTTAAVTPST